MTNDQENNELSAMYSLDPRITRLHISPDNGNFQPLETPEYFETYEVFHQPKSGAKHVHVGSVHAPNLEMAFVFAKEQYTRRFSTNSLWVARTADIFTLSDGESDMYETTPEKQHRSPAAYKVRDRISQYKKKQEHG